MTTLQIAWAKENFLEHALRLIIPDTYQKAQQESLLIQDIEDLVQDASQLFTTLLRCDEQHNLLVATQETYPYQAKEEELTVLFRRFLLMCEMLYTLSHSLQQQGLEITNWTTLKETRDHARRLVEDDQAFYATTTYHTLAEQAYTDYKSGHVEPWPT